ASASSGAASPRRWPSWPRSSRPTERPTSPASPSPSTAAAPASCRADPHRRRGSLGDDRHTSPPGVSPARVRGTEMAGEKSSQQDVIAHDDLEEALLTEGDSGAVREEAVAPHLRAIGDLGRGTAMDPLGDIALGYSDLQAVLNEVLERI